MLFKDGLSFNKSIQLIPVFSLQSSSFQVLDLHALRLFSLEFKLPSLTQKVTPNQMQVGALKLNHGRIH